MFPRLIFFNSCTCNVSAKTRTREHEKGPAYSILMRVWNQEEETINNPESFLFRTLFHHRIFLTSVLVYIMYKVWPSIRCLLYSVLNIIVIIARGSLYRNAQHFIFILSEIQKYELRAHENRLEIHPSSTSFISWQLCLLECYQS